MTSQNVLTVTNIPYNCDSSIHYALLSWSTIIDNTPEFDFIIGQCRNFNAFHLG